MNYDLSELSNKNTYLPRAIIQPLEKDESKIKENDRPYFVNFADMENKNMTMIPDARKTKSEFQSLALDKLDTVYKIKGTEDKRVNDEIIQVYLPDELDRNYKSEGRERRYKMYSVNFGHTVLNIPDTIECIKVAIENNLTESFDQKERMLKSLHRVLNSYKIFNYLNNEQLLIIMQAIDMINIPKTPVESNLPRFISKETYDKYTATINIYILNVIVDKPLVIQKKDGEYMEIYLTDIYPLLNKGYEIDLGLFEYTVLDNNIQYHRDLELGLASHDQIYTDHLRDELVNILD